MGRGNTTNKNNPAIVVNSVENRPAENIVSLGSAGVVSQMSSK